MEDKLHTDLANIVKDLTFTRKPTKARMKQITKDLMAKLEDKLKGTTEKELEKIYKQTLADVEKQLNLDIGFDANDQLVLDSLKTDKLFTEAYEGMTKALSKDINKIILDAYKDPGKFSPDKIVERMKEVTNEKEGKLSVIARTETQHISNLARMNSYEKADSENKMKFIWSTIEDTRRTDTCKEIASKTSKGVSRTDLKRIIKEVSEKNGHNPRDFTPHVNCRSRALRFFGD